MLEKVAVSAAPELGAVGEEFPPPQVEAISPASRSAQRARPSRAAGWTFVIVMSRSDSGQAFISDCKSPAKGPACARQPFSAARRGISRQGFRDSKADLRQAWLMS